MTLNTHVKVPVIILLGEFSELILMNALFSP